MHAMHAPLNVVFVCLREANFLLEDLWRMQTSREGVRLRNLLQIGVIVIREDTTRAGFLMR